MPNKYYLREDRTACSPTMKEPIQWDYETISMYNWSQHIASLPALTVDPDYLKRLGTGWFEGEERYEQECWDKWEEISKDEFDNTPYNKRLTIVAPQEAEKDLRVTGVVQDVDRTALEFDKIRSEIALVGKKCIQCGKEFTDRSGGSYCSIQCWDAHCLHGVPHLEQPATQQPVTGEAEEFDTWLGKERDAFVVSILEAPWNTEQRVQAENILIAFDQARERLQAASRQSDAVELLKELCQLNHYKDNVGKDSFYEKREQELWKIANDYLNSLSSKH